MLGNQMIGGGVPAGSVLGILGGVATGIAAAGTTSATATALGAVALHAVATTAASTGVRVPQMNPGESMAIFNGGASTLAVYPATGGTANGGSTDAGVNVATLLGCNVFCIAPLTYLILVSA